MNSLPQNDPARQLPKSYEQLEAENADLRSRLASLEAAYSDLQRENQRQYADLQNWNMCTGWALAEKAEGRES